jgi:hypothetical protein
MHKVSDRLDVRLSKPYDGWSCAAQTHAKKVGMLEMYQVFETGHERLTIGLMQTVPKRFPQERVVLTLQRTDQ